LVKAFVMKISNLCFFSIDQILSSYKIFLINDIENFICMGKADDRNSSYVFTSKVHYYIIGAHLLCTNYINSFFIEVENLEPSQLCI
jgi:hypothetical protein